MTTEMGNKLKEFARILKQDGWEAADKYCEDNKSFHGDFRKWCEAIAVYVSAEEIVEASTL